jgi:hypothetical protein
MTRYTGARRDEMPRIVTGEGWVYAVLHGGARIFCTVECKDKYKAALEAELMGLD